ncbi:MAG: NAD+ synthase [Bacteroidales bacterium]|nr:NAD+ synthase [Bacteroidales bacterium]MDY0140578.1 NAD+ synthase [Bacteroidales bacterium]
MKIALSQLNFHIGNLNYNSEKIINAINKAKTENVDLIIFSELSVCGYCPLDMLEHRNFIKDCNDAINKIVIHTTGIAVIIGSPTINPHQKGKKLYNSAIFIKNQAIIKTVNKTLLPTYDVFDETRYFEPNDVFEIIEYKNKKIALTICADLWDEQRTNGNFTKDILFENNPLKYLSKCKPDFIVNIAATPYSFRHAKIHEDILINNAKKYSTPIIYVNQIGANTDLIYDGGSLVINNKGQKVIEANYFEEDFTSINLDDINQLQEIQVIKQNKYADIYKALVLGVSDYCEKSGFKKAVIGLSGGIDSALTLAIAVGALGAENVDAILMPSIYSSEHSVIDAIDMAERCKIKYHIINIEELRLSFDNSMSGVFEGTKQDVTEENIQARIRGSVLMAYSNKFGHILLNPSNKSEIAIGYSTMYGDMNGAISVLGDIYKTEVYELANYINQNIKNIIPQNTITKAPSAELRPNQQDNDNLPDYELLDRILFEYIENQLSANEIEKLVNNRKTINSVIKLVNNSEFKRFQSPPIIRISSKAFGTGRKMPIVAKF